MGTAAFGTRLLTVLSSLGALVVLVPAASADFAGGKAAKSDCYVVYKGFAITKGKNKSECTDGDPACDTDGACDGSCTFSVTACTNGTVATCSAANVTSITFKGASIDTPTLPTTENLCGDASPVKVDIITKANGKKKKGKVKVSATAEAPDAKPTKDKDAFTLFCVPRPEGDACPPQGTTTTTITVPSTCCGLKDNPNVTAGWLGLTTDAGTGDSCGFKQDAAGAQTPLTCAGLYFGGGQNGVPIPVDVPDQGRAVSKIVACDQPTNTATVGPATSADTGSNLNCTDTGCFFGAPLAVPNAMTIPLSTCVLNQLASGVSGTTNCSTGESNVSAPLSSLIYLTGDGKTDPGNSINGIQPCPLCSANICIGGPNNGMACTPGTTALTNSYPTSHDCPPDESTSIGALPVAFVLSSGSVTWRATAATNDTGSTASRQTRVFSGFCRDQALPGATGSFDVSPDPGTQLKKCWENGMAVGTPCSEADNSCESCEQRNNGAFGPDGGAISTITVVGQASGSLTTGSGIGKLAGIFSIPPTEDAQVNAAGDLPGPGAVTLPGTAKLCADAMACP
jgi:hypothetical protein